MIVILFSSLLGICLCVGCLQFVQESVDLAPMSCILATPPLLNQEYQNSTYNMTIVLSLFGSLLKPFVNLALLIVITVNVNDVIEYNLIMFLMIAWIFWLLNVFIWCNIFQLAKEDMEQERFKNISSTAGINSCTSVAQLKELILFGYHIDIDVICSGM